MSTVLIPAHIGQTAGPLLLGYMFNWGLFGILTVQSYLYYLSFPRDRSFTKGLVFTVWLLEFAQTLIATRDAFKTLGSGWGEPSALTNPWLTWFSVQVMSGVTGFIVQSFYAWRISVLSRSRVLAGVIIALALTASVAAIIQGATTLRLGDLSAITPLVFKADVIWLTTSAACDLIIAFTMTFFLLRSSPGFWSTRFIFFRLFGLVIGSGLAATTIAIIHLILFLSFRHKYYQFAISLALAKLYANSLLAQLNSRVRILQRDGYAATGPGMRKNGGATGVGMVGGLAYRNEFSAAATGLDFLSTDSSLSSAGANAAFTVNGSRDREQRTWISMTTSMHDNEATRRNAKAGLQVGVGRDDEGDFVDHKYPPDGIAVGVMIHRETDLERGGEAERATKARNVKFEGGYGNGPQGWHDSPPDKYPLGPPSDEQVSYLKL